MAVSMSMSMPMPMPMPKRMVIHALGHFSLVIRTWMMLLMHTHERWQPPIQARLCWLTTVPCVGKRVWMLTGDVNGLYAGRNQVRRALLHAASIQHCRSVRVASAGWPVTELGA